MAGNITAKERAAVTLTSSGASIATGSAGSANDIDFRAGGNAPDDFEAVYELTCQWATITGIVAGTVVAELYLVPKLDGTNAIDIDTTASTSVIPGTCYAGAFQAAKAPVANTNMRFISPPEASHPLLYTAYIINRSGQTMTANWTLKAVSTQGQYT